MEFWNGVLASLPVIIAAMVGQYLLLRKSRREDRQVDATLTEKQRAAQVKQRREDDRIARDEYRELFEEVKRENVELRREHRRCDRRLARAEASLIAAGIPLQPFPDDDTNETSPLPDRRGP